MKRFNICSAISKSAMTPSFIGRTATMFPGVRPSIFFASAPTARTFSVFFSTATTEGSFSTIPFPWTYTSVVAVPKSMARSFENQPKMSLVKPTMTLPSAQIPITRCSRDGATPSVGECQPADVQHLRTRQFIAKPTALFVSDNQDRFKDHDRPGGHPTDIGNRKRQLGDCKGDVTDYGFPKPCRLTRIRKNRLKADQPLPNASTARKPIGNEQISQTCKKPYGNNHFGCRCCKKYIDEFGDKPVENLRLGVNPDTQWMNPNLFRQGISLQLVAKYNKFEDLAQTNHHSVTKLVSASVEGMLSRLRQTCLCRHLWVQFAPFH